MRRLTTGPFLVTGGTGFVGRALIRHLLAEGRTVVALVRDRSDQPAPERIARAVGYAPDGRQLVVVTGDLARPDSLDPADLDLLRATVETVIHCAGDTCFFPTEPASFWAGHIDGPVALLRRLAGVRLMRWLQVSTAFVCGRRSGTAWEHEGDVGQAFHNSYERVKLEAEIAMGAAATDLGIDLRVVRPSIVVGEAPATAGGRPAGLFFDFVRLIAGSGRWAQGRAVPLRIAAAPGAPFSIVPIDYVVATIVTLAEHPAAAGGTFHAVVADAPNQETMLAMIAARLDVRGPRLVERGALLAPSALERRVARMLDPYREYLTHHVRFDDTRARAVLEGAGVPRPRLNARAVDNLIDAALTPAAPILETTA